jgi:hypothetical protein
LILASTTPAVVGCAPTALIGTPPPAFNCSALIPASDRTAVPPTPLPGTDATAGALWIALDDQTARLDQANGRTADVLDIQQRCEAERTKAQTPARTGLFGWLKF